MEPIRESSYCIGVQQKLWLFFKTNGLERFAQNAGVKEAVAKGTDLMDDARRTATGLQVAQREAHVSLAQALVTPAPPDSC